tara:strand:+ start:3414 stop:4178 length:765 start_codon:yes stop_codon:yes gene_type:complete
MKTKDEISKFYDKFNDRLLKDYVYGNLRVQKQLSFFQTLINRSGLNILVVGCGIGDVTFELAKNRSKPDKVLGVDISSKNINLACRLFANDNLEYRRCDIISENLEDGWDLILFPDVYEHIPTDLRSKLHYQLKGLLKPEGIVALTCPTVQHQNYLRERGEGLQVVDEDVTVRDLDVLASDLNGYITSYAHVRFPRAPHQYFHATIARIGSVQRDRSKYPIERMSISKRIVSRVQRKVCQMVRKRRIDRIGISL